MISRSAADDAPAIDNACGVFGEDALPRCKNTVTEEAPLTAMCVAANGELDIGVADVRLVIFGMVAKQNTELGGVGKGGKCLLVRAILLLGQPSLLASLSYQLTLKLFIMY